MSAEFWSHWGWPLATAVLALSFSVLVMRQWLERNKPHQLAWAFGLLIYGVAAVMEFYSELTGTWDVGVYRIYIVLAASLVGFLGLGTLYLMARKRIWGHLYLAFNLVMMAVFLYGTFTTKLDMPQLVAGVTVGGKALGGYAEFPRVLGFAFNIPGTILLLGGAVISIFRFAKKEEYAYRMWANVLIALGTIIIAGAGSMARAGKTVGLYPAEMIASAILLAGFLKAGTLQKGVSAIKAKREAAAEGDTPVVSD